MTASIHSIQKYYNNLGVTKQDTNNRNKTICNKTSFKLNKQKTTEIQQS